MNLAAMKSVEEILEDLDPALSGRIVKALDLLRVQARGAERLREGVRTIIKADRSPVTIADLLHQSQLQHMLAREFPADGLISEEPHALQVQVIEEAARASAEFYGVALEAEVIELPESGEVVWIFDPIDGTKGYLGGRYYAIALGFFRKGEPVFGAMAVPARPAGRPLRIGGALAFAVRGGGAWVEHAGAEGSRTFERIRTAAAELRKPLRVAVSLEHGNTHGRFEQGGDAVPVKLDSQAKYLAVALGELDVYLRERRKDGHPDVTWDHMPGALIAAEAGCTVRQFDGGPIEFAPRPVIRFDEGFVCHRGGRGGPIHRWVGEFLGHRSGNV